MTYFSYPRHACTSVMNINFAILFNYPAGSSDSVISQFDSWTFLKRDYAVTATSWIVEQNGKINIHDTGACMPRVTKVCHNHFLSLWLYCCFVVCLAYTHNTT